MTELYFKNTSDTREREIKIYALGKNDILPTSPQFTSLDSLGKAIGIKLLPDNQDEEIDDTLFTKATYIQTDISSDIWVDVQYSLDNSNGKLHVNWGDGVKEVIDPSQASEENYFISLSHTYEIEGEYIVKIYSTTTIDVLTIGEITKVTDWGEVCFSQLVLNSRNLIEVPATLHPSMINLESMFQGANGFNQDISGWDVSNVTNMESMFNGASLFNKPIGSWNVSKVEGMNAMFNRASSFNQDLSQWCVSNFSGYPSNFNTNGVISGNYLPKWGTCPRGENQV